MIDYIIYGEFDINEGNVIKVEYPQKLGINETILSSYLIPEGTHNIMNDCFCFVLNKKTNSEDILIESMKKQVDKFNLGYIKYIDLGSFPYYNSFVKDKVFKIKEIYNYNSFTVKWESMNMSENFMKNKTDCISFKINKDPKESFFNMIIFQESEIFFSIPIHNDIQFKKLSETFASIYTLNSQAIGFEFVSEEEIATLEKLFDNENVEITNNKSDDIQTTNEAIDLYSFFNQEKELYFICCLETKLDKNTKRGAILKSVAIGTYKLVNLYNFKPLLKFLLEEIFKICTFNIKNEEKINLITKTIDLLYKSVNSIASSKFGLDINPYEGYLNYHLLNSTYFSLPCHMKKSNKDTNKLQDTNLPNLDPNPFEIEIGVQKLNLEIKVANYREKIFPGNLIELIKTFKDNTMIIYDAILSDKKILFIGDASTSCETLCNFIFSTVSMVSPPCFGILKRIHPYKNLYDMEFLKSNNCIYGVTNPIFKIKTDAWDIMCEIDTGKITINENYKKYLNAINRESDQFFIKELIYKIKHENLSECEVERYFKNYTNHLFKITGELYFSDDDDLTTEINKQYKRKLKLQNSTFWKIECQMEKIRQFIQVNGKSLNLIQRHVDNLYYRKNIEREECLLIFSDIEKFISGGDLYIKIVNYFIYFI